MGDAEWGAGGQAGRWTEACAFPEDLTDALTDPTDVRLGQTDVQQGSPEVYIMIRQTSAQI